MDISDVEAFIMNASKEDVEAIYSALKYKHSKEIRSATSKFSVGDKVSFIGRNGTKIVGIVDRINRKTVSIKTDVGMWRVTSTLLKKE